MDAMYGVYEHSHWQGAGPPEVIYTGSREACLRYVDQMNSCSFCSGRRPAGGYSIGRCLSVGKPRYIRHHTPQLPDAILAWDASDTAAWEADLLDQDAP